MITKKFDKHYIFTLASISHWHLHLSQSTGKSALYNVYYRSLWTASFDFMWGRLVGFDSVKICQLEGIWIHLDRSDSLGMFAEEPAKSDLAHSLTVLPAGGEKLLLSDFGWQWEGPYCVMESRWGEDKKESENLCLFKVCRSRSWTLSDVLICGDRENWGNCRKQTYSRLCLLLICWFIWLRTRFAQIHLRWGQKLSLILILISASLI